MENNYLNNTVKINNGSGCIIHPSGSEYTYILTAKHVLKNISKNKDLKIIKYYYNEKGNIQNEIINSEIITFHKHINSKKDAALIVLKRINSTNNPVFSNIEKDKQYLICGFPTISNDKYDEISSKSKFDKNEYWEFLTTEPTTYNQKELEGISGGGVFETQMIANPILVGIESQMTDKDNDYHGRIDIMPLSFFNIGFDEIAIEQYEKLKTEDKRNLNDKLNDACPSISKERRNLFNREFSIGKAEIDRLDFQEVSALKYRVFEVCQEELLDFVETNNSHELSVEDIRILIEKFTDKAYERIKDRTSDYDYIKKSRDFLKRIVFDLINDCFLSFDKEGLYEF